MQIPVQSHLLVILSSARMQNALPRLRPICNAMLQMLSMHIKRQLQHTLIHDSDLASFILSVHEAV
jgi:hypothetical protein